ncbi:cell wall glycosyl hydrolase YteR [Stachybotrys elegans]|uniref:Cell wall glycosyl hydrolase YteR n=1 Tax=Stachybotrys elegans TaxID=80388 RepID=A0A8K0SKB2_9HYPO|nr:cell wall glycosyl hydrolase YteR [Stachybotrys elegans]
MKPAILLVGTAAAAAAAVDSVLARMASSYIQRPVRQSWGYDEATLYFGLQASLLHTQDEAVVAWLRNQIDAVVLGDGSIKDFNHTYYSLDNYRIANNYLWWYERTGEDKFKIAADSIRAQLNRHPRTPLGGFWHRQPNYPNQMWLDGIFMADNFYAKWTSLFDADNTTAWDDIVGQYDLIDSRTHRLSSNLRVHGYDESKVAVWADDFDGRSPLVWSRALGWYAVSLVDLLGDFPKTHPGYERLLGYFQSVGNGLKRSIDDGGWWLVMDFPGRDRNYLESSASAMFTYALLKGVRLGYLPASYQATADKAFETLVDRWVTENEDGTLNWEGTVEVGSLNSNASFEYYVSVPIQQNDHRGGGAFLLAAYEAEVRSKQD